MSTTPVSRDTVSSAVASLGKWMHGRSAASKPQLLLDDRDDFFVLLLSLRRIPSNCRTNPFFLSIPHPIFPLSDPTLSPSVFLIIDDRAADSPPPSKFLEEAKECNLPISEVIGISTLRTDYRAFESRRKLCGSHDLFLADKKILPLLPRLLGKSFFQKKKNPLPVNFSRVGWKDQIKRILNSTFFYLRSGTCCAIRVGRLAMEVEHVVDNVMAAIDEAVEKIPKKWENVRSLNLKAVDSVALPIYQAVPEIGLKIEIGEREDSGAEDVLDGDEVVEEKSEKKKKKKKGVRYMDGVPLAGEELVKGDGEGEGEEEKRKKRKKRSKEGTGGETNLDEIEVIKKKKKAGTGGDEEVKLKQKKGGAGDKFGVLEMEVKTKKKKNRQENIEIEVINCAKTKTKKEKIGNVDRKLSNEIVEKMEREEKRKGKNLEAVKEVKKGEKNKTKV
ncbi:ribosomal L1 domain-containing protein 1-like protein [Carex littledalei]|uniref:Ribosomal L1 domain-containing protein 1-like protein n=1 Tax=Carex littledalei TaxID=544730 RepID=A0A833R5Z4_9POAL|nr:ribosomal L1 domain-containing protein 1-like protein [Carex littledalei]